MERFGKRSDLIVHEEEPFNAETGLGALARARSRTDAFYVRSHGSVPEIDPAGWHLHVGGLVERELELSLETLREAFRECEVTATLQCAERRVGPSRRDSRERRGGRRTGPPWSGVPLAEVLCSPPRRGAADVGFEGAGPRGGRARSER